MFKKAFFVIFWFLVIPAAVARLAAVVTRERITDQPRAYIEARWPDTAFDYLVHCPVCVSHWLAAGFVAACARPWRAALPADGARPWYATLALLTGVWAATTESAFAVWKADRKP